jgi:O-antigen ligase
VILKIYLNELTGVWLTGFGLGNTPSFPPFYYPHNFLVEFATEFGILGVIFILPLTVLIVKTLLALTLSEREHCFVMFLAINYVFFFLKSGSIYDSYTLFAVFSVVLVMNKKNRKSSY